MRSEHIIVIPSGATQETLNDTVQILVDHELPHELVSEEELLPYLGLSTLPAMAIVQAARLTVEMIDVMRHLNARSVPSLTVLEEGTEDHEVTLLQSGAWEVLTLTHVSERRLRTRIATLHRNLTTLVAETAPELYEIENLVVDPTRREVTVDGRPVDLSKVEFDLLLTLARNQDRLCTREELSAHLGESKSEGRSLEVNMSRLRVKIESAGGPRLGESVRGMGYRLGV